MAFVVKDLMIYILRGHGLSVNVPQGGGLQQGGGPGGCCASAVCTYCSDGCSVGCSGPCSQGQCSQQCTTISRGHLGDILTNPADLVALKQRLKIALAEVEAREAAIRAEMLPQTLEEAEDLERHLASALEEVRALKPRLERSGGGRAAPQT
jgi:hypothetical protein